MLKKITHTGLLILLLSYSLIVIAGEPGYEALKQPQPTLTHHPDKIEVIEFFWYECSHCYSFEPILEAWLKNKPENVEFIRLPAAFIRLWGSSGAKAYFVAEALGIVEFKTEIIRY